MPELPLYLLVSVTSGVPGITIASGAFCELGDGIHGDVAEGELCHA